MYELLEVLEIRIKAIIEENRKLKNTILSLEQENKRMLESLDLERVRTESLLKEQEKESQDRILASMVVKDLIDNLDPNYSSNNENSFDYYNPSKNS